MLSSGRESTPANRSALHGTIGAALRLLLSNSTTVSLGNSAYSALRKVRLILIRPIVLVLALLQLRNTVVAEARPPAPDGNVTVMQRELPDGIVALQATELEGRREVPKDTDTIGFAKSCSFLS